MWFSGQMAVGASCHAVEGLVMDVFGNVKHYCYVIGSQHYSSSSSLQECGCLPGFFIVDCKLLFTEISIMFTWHNIAVSIFRISFLGSGSFL